MSSVSLQFEHLAMNTRWRMVLRGPDSDELQAIANSCHEMLDYWDRILSRFDPVSEVHRINRAQPGEILRLQPKLFELLELCSSARQTTQGFFDVALPSRQAKVTNKTENECYQLDPQKSTFSWLAPNHQLDLGGIAKGYVLDQLSQDVQGHSVVAALFDAGGSSLLAWSSKSEATPWRVILSPPGEGPRELIVGALNDVSNVQTQPTLPLHNEALSYSATRSPGTRSGQTFDPRTNSEVSEQRACVIVTKSATWAEILSTAALCMGEAEAATYIKAWGLVECRMGWLDGDDVRWYASQD
jgi:thiamine biosynthesis lipoprotein